MLVKLTYFTLCICSFLIFIFVVINSFRGYDLTDESFYQLWMSMPSNFPVSVTQFGFVYHPIYKFFHGNIAGVRICNDALTYILACFATIGIVCQANEYKFSWSNVPIVLGTASSSLVVTAFELPQGPSYNTLALQALLLGTAAVAFADHEKRFVWTLLCWAIVGCAGALAFLAKPPSAVVFGLACVIYCIVKTRRFLPLILAGSVALASLSIFAWLSIGSPFALAERIRGALKISASLSESYGLLGLLSLSDIPFNVAQFEVLAMGTILVATFLMLSGLSSRFSFAIAPLITMAICIAAIATLVVSFPFAEPFQRYDGMQTTAVLLGSIVAFSFFGDWDRQMVLSLTFMLALPFAYAWGTGRPLWLNLEGASYFWFAGALYLIFSLREKSQKSAMAFIAASSVLATSMFLASSWAFPFRQSQPLKADDFRLEIGPSAGNLLVATDLGAYISSMRMLAAKADFKIGTPVVDLTGHSPGTVFLLGGRPPGVAWLSGGSPGTEAYAAKALALAGCSIVSQAWLITEIPNPERSPTPAVLHQFGLDIATDYTDLGAVNTDRGIFSEIYQQHLWKPSHSASFNKCNAR